MKTLREIIAEQQGRRDSDDPLVDKLVAEILLLAESNCVLRDRLDTMERLAAAGKNIDEASVNEYLPDEHLTQERLERHKQFFEELFQRLAS